MQQALDGVWDGNGDKWQDQPKCSLQRYPSLELPSMEILLQKTVGLPLQRTAQLIVHLGCCLQHPCYCNTSQFILGKGLGAGWTGLRLQYPPA